MNINYNRLADDVYLIIQRILSERKNKTPIALNEMGWPRDVAQSEVAKFLETEIEAAKRQEKQAEKDVKEFFKNPKHRKMIRNLS